MPQKQHWMLEEVFLCLRHLSCGVQQLLRANPPRPIWRQHKPGLWTSQQLQRYCLRLLAAPAVISKQETSQTRLLGICTTPAFLQRRAATAVASKLERSQPRLLDL